ncbi:class I SAM-dependent methyltransferase [Sorangium sp. So ce1000]|uniref:class I SAM-dependent methyltransferase n=1 Tax=Sorangium sp. So ce1000 TaxID=3133325 RepID=UPI003F6180C0
MSSAADPSAPPPPALEASEYSWLVGFEGDWRDTWWNRDFLELIARRLRLGEVRAAVDVGCGVGHWGRILLPVLHGEATLVGVDREPSFVARAAAEAEARGIAARTSYREGLAEALPLPDASVDLATCQTVLMHVADPLRVLREMRRVLRPGGVLLAVEPNNFAEKATALVTAPGLTRAERLALLELDAICQDGKRALGQGDCSVGERLPGLLREAGLGDLHVVQSDKCAALIPPYETPAERAELRQMLAWIDGGAWLGAGGTRDQTHAWYLAGGGDPAQFERLWAIAMQEARAWKEAALARTLCGAHGVTFYLVSGRKPA